MDWDCQTCGACCANLRANLAQGSTYWVQIEPTAKIRQRDDLLRKFVTYNRAGEPHMRMTPTGECLALSGTIGDKVACRIYHQRPGPCRRVQPGDETCLRSRRDRGLVNE